jgi:hypothetical protein
VRNGDIEIMDERGYTKIVDLNRDALTVSGSNILKKQCWEDTPPRAAQRKVALFSQT